MEKYIILELYYFKTTNYLGLVIKTLDFLENEIEKFLIENKIDYKNDQIVEKFSENFDVHILIKYI